MYIIHLKNVKLFFKNNLYFEINRKNKLWMKTVNFCQSSLFFPFLIVWIRFSFRNTDADLHRYWIGTGSVGFYPCCFYRRDTEPVKTTSLYPESMYRTAERTSSSSGSNQLFNSSSSSAADRMRGIGAAGNISSSSTPGRDARLFDQKFTSYSNWERNSAKRDYSVEQQQTSNTSSASGYNTARSGGREVVEPQRRIAMNLPTSLPVVTGNRKKQIRIRWLWPVLRIRILLILKDPDPALFGVKNLKGCSVKMLFLFT